MNLCFIRCAKNGCREIAHTILSQKMETPAGRGTESHLSTVERRAHRFNKTTHHPQSKKIFSEFALWEEFVLPPAARSIPQTPSTKARDA
jgi:hypothetical protein